MTHWANEQLRIVELQAELVEAQQYASALEEGAHRAAELLAEANRYIKHLEAENVVLSDEVADLSYELDRVIHEHASVDSDWRDAPPVDDDEVAARIEAWENAGEDI